MNSHQIQIGAQVFNFSVVIEKDDDHGAPWVEEDGHGPVSEWTTRAKQAGELVLNDDKRGHRRYYDFAEACKKALAEGWDDTPSKIEGEPETKRQQAARAARADFEHLQAWCNEEWYYTFITVTLLDRDGNPTTHTDSIGGTDNDYAEEQARLMCDELASQVDASGPTSEELNLLPLSRLDELHNELRDVHQGESDDDTDFDVWVQDMADNNRGTYQAAALEYLRLSNDEQHAESVAIAAQVNGDEHLAEDCTLMAKLLEASQDDNAKLKAALAVALGSLESLLTLADKPDVKAYGAARVHALAVVKGCRLDNPPPLRWDGCHGFSIATTGQRFATIANAFKGSGEQADDGTALVHALARLGAVALTY